MGAYALTLLFLISTNCIINMDTDSLADPKTT